ncbi:MAG: hypothetical protein L6Q57_02320 [Alphaproteobacteria bacterium]|nr:hypothetical protein [Alphaproteobacteria bacterium]
MAQLQPTYRRYYNASHADLLEEEREALEARKKQEAAVAWRAFEKALRNPRVTTQELQFILKDHDYSPFGFHHEDVLHWERARADVLGRLEGEDTKLTDDKVKMIIAHMHYLGTNQRSKELSEKLAIFMIGGIVLLGLVAFSAKLRQRPTAVPTSFGPSATP